MVKQLVKGALVVCGLMLVVSVAAASVPSATNSIVGPNNNHAMNLVGSTGGVADVRGEFKITVKDLAGNLINGSSVVIDFSGCYPDIRICSVQTFSGVVTDCNLQTREVSLVTGAIEPGEVIVRIVGAATPGPAAGFQCATVYADGVNLGGLIVGAFDLDGQNGVQTPDLARWLSDTFSAPYEGRSDYDGNGLVAPPDLSRWLSVSFGSGSANSCPLPSYCD